MIKLNNIPKVNNLRTNGGNEAPNQFEIRVGDNVIFQSYDSVICIVNYNNNVITFGGDWDYSRTTSKYLYQFLRGLGLDVRLKKDILDAIKEGYLENSYTRWTVEENYNL